MDKNPNARYVWLRWGAIAYESIFAIVGFSYAVLSWEGGMLLFGLFHLAVAVLLWRKAIRIGVWLMMIGAAVPCLFYWWLCYMMRHEIPGPAFAAMAAAVVFLLTIAPAFGLGIPLLRSEIRK